VTTTFEGCVSQKHHPIVAILFPEAVLFLDNTLESYNAGFLLKPFYHHLHLARSKCNKDFSPLFAKRFSSLFEATVRMFAKSNYEIERNRSLRVLLLQ